MQLQPYKLLAFCSRYIIKKIEKEHAYLMSMNITVCTDIHRPCEQTYVVLENALFPIVQCSPYAEFAVKSKYLLR